MCDVNFRKYLMELFYSFLSNSFEIEFLVLTVRTLYNLKFQFAVVAVISSHRNLGK